MWVGVALTSVTFDLCHTPPLAWQEPPKPVCSVNEVEDPGGIVSTFWLEEELSV